MRAREGGGAPGLGGGETERGREQARGPDRPPPARVRGQASGKAPPCREPVGVTRSCTLLLTGSVGWGSRPGLARAPRSPVARREPRTVTRAWVVRGEVTPWPQGAIQWGRV